jgi:hypothetical protein
VGAGGGEGKLFSRKMKPEGQTYVEKGIKDKAKIEDLGLKLLLP